MIKQYKIVFLLGIVCICIRAVFSQAPDTLWTKTYGGTKNDWGASVQQTVGGGYFVAGSRDYQLAPSTGNIYLIKTDENGDTIWTKIYGGPQLDLANCGQQTTDSGYIVVGTTENFGAGKWDVWFLKTDADGETLWTKTYGGTDYEEGISVQQTFDNGYVIAGFTESFGAGGSDVYLIKTDENGDTIWTNTYGGENHDQGRSIQQTSDSGYVIAGFTESFGAGDRDVYLIRTDENGDTIWTNTYGGINLDAPRSIQKTPDGGYIIAGCTYSFGIGTPNYCNVYLIKTNENGDTLWTKIYGGTDHDAAYSVQTTSDNGYIFVGNTRSFGAGNYDVYLMKTDVIGETLWTKTIGGVNSDGGYSVQQTSDEGYIVVGWTWVSDLTDWDLYLIKTEPDLSIAENQIVSDRSLINLEIYPNPFHAKTDISFYIGQSAQRIELKIYNVSGRLIKSFPHSTLNALRPTLISWDGRDNYGQILPAGVYLCCVEIGEFIATEKIIKLK